MIKTNNISGFNELLPEEELVQQYLIDLLKKEFKLNAFLPMETASVERNEVLLAKEGIETKEIYQLTKLSRPEEIKDFSLRFDLTLPLTRYVSENSGKIVFPFKRYQIQKVWRGERPAKGRFREFYQADIDIIGENKLSISYDSEIISIMNNFFKKINICDFKFKINNRKLQLGLFNELNILSESYKILKILDDIEKVSIEKTKEELKKLNLSNENIQKLINFTILPNNIKAISDFSNNEIYQEGIEELKEFLKELMIFGVENKNVFIDTKIARGLDYYTGLIFETEILNDPMLGSVCSGGRYENLTKGFSKLILPGVGISLGLSRLVSIILDKNLISLPSQKNSNYVIFTSKDKEKMIEISKKIRSFDIPCELTFFDNLKQEIKYAKNKGYRYAILSGNDDTFILRDLSELDRTYSDKLFLEEFLIIVISNSEDL